MPAIPSKKIRIAVVDDHDSFRTATSALLEARGFATCTFASVAEFVGSGAIHRIDCLLLDLVMPDIDGLALQEALQHTNYQFPIIFCSGVNDDEGRERALEMGAAHFLQKPIDSVLLIKTIHSACGEHGSSPGPTRVC